MFGGGSSSPSETPQQQALDTLQQEQGANLDVQENDQRKRELAAAQGIRNFNGSAATFPSAIDAPAGGTGSGGYDTGSTGVPGGGGGNKSNVTALAGMGSGMFTSAARTLAPGR